MESASATGVAGELRHSATVVNAAAFTEVPDYRLESKPGQLTRRQLQQFYDDVSIAYSRLRHSPSLSARPFVCVCLHVGRIKNVKTLGLKNFVYSVAKV